MANKHRPPLTLTCTLCKKEYVGHSHVRKFCDACKKEGYKKAQKRGWTKANHKFQAKQHATYQSGKSKCLLCGAWVKAPAMHAYQKHNVSAREYKEAYNLPYGKGLLSPELKEIKREYVFANGTVENLKKGARTRIQKGEERRFDGVKRRAELGQTKQPHLSTH